MPRPKRVVRRIDELPRGKTVEELEADARYQQRPVKFAARDDIDVIANQAVELLYNKTKAPCAECDGTGLIMTHWTQNDVWFANACPNMNCRVGAVHRAAQNMRRKVKKAFDKQRTDAMLIAAQEDLDGLLSGS